MRTGPLIKALSRAAIGLSTMSNAEVEEQESGSCDPCELSKQAAIIKGIVERNTLECVPGEGVPKGWAGSYRNALEEAGKMEQLLARWSSPEGSLLRSKVLALAGKLSWVGDCNRATEAFYLANEIWLEAGTLTKEAFVPSADTSPEVPSRIRPLLSDAKPAFCPACAARESVT